MARIAGVRNTGAEVAEKVPSNENAPLNAPDPITSVPTRSQSGSRLASRIHVCKSGLKGVPLTMGFGAESQRKSPLVNITCGTKK